ncbi:Glutamate racemase [Lactiplantibacillus plantarum subsp. plantarum]|nr:Glutamate racemase [Lactiplantibacillus plantarum subsp. plantarum]
MPLVESNEYQSTVAKRVVAETLKQLKKQDVDTLVLGCTHYPLLRPLIQNVMGPGVTLIDSGAETVNDVSAVLDYLDIANDRSTKRYPDEYYTTGRLINSKQSRGTGWANRTFTHNILI